MYIIFYSRVSSLYFAKLQVRLKINKYIYITSIPQMKNGAHFFANIIRANYLHKSRLVVVKNDHTSKLN